MHSTTVAVGQTATLWGTRCRRSSQTFWAESVWARTRKTFGGAGLVVAHAGARLVAGVAVDHGLDVDRRAPVVGDVVHAAVGDGAVVAPAAEDGADGAPELGARVVREVLAGALLDGRLELGDELLEVVGRELGVER